MASIINHVGATPIFDTLVPTTTFPSGEGTRIDCAQARLPSIPEPGATLPEKTL
jgi:hypothetical protein